MDKGSIGGVILAIAGIAAGLLIEGGKISQILQPTAALIVFGGTMGATLRQIAESLTGTPYDVRVEGHTDTMPIHNAEFDSNWELSSARATRIARLLLQMHTIRPEQLSAAGYAEYHPIASNFTADGRAENRRVDLVVMPRVFLDLSSSDIAEDKTGWRKITDQ